MKEQLEQILEIIENYLKREVWMSTPPLSEIDYKIIMLGIEILKQKDNCENIKNNEVITDILLNYIKEEFDVPTNKFLNIYNDKYSVVEEVYNSLLKIKSQ